MVQFTRRIIGFGVHAGDVDGVVLCRLFNNAISTQDIPRYISSDNDPLFRYHRWQANLRILDVEEIKALPYTPLSHPFVERLIGTIRREYLDHTLFWNAEDLERKLEDFRQYYNHASLHTPFYVVEKSNWFWLAGGSAGELERLCTRLTSFLAASLSNVFRLNIQGPSPRG